MAHNSNASSMTWLTFALLTVVSWGVYGAFLHTGQSSISQGGGDPAIARYKAFLFFGVAYFLTAVLAPLLLLLVKGAAWSAYSGKGMGWFLFAGFAGSIGVFVVLLLFAGGGNPGGWWWLVLPGRRWSMPCIRSGNIHRPVVGRRSGRNSSLEFCWRPWAGSWSLTLNQRRPRRPSQPQSRPRG